MRSFKFWIIVAVMAMFYFLSWGPACLVIDRKKCPTDVQHALDEVYTPCHWLYRNGPTPVRVAYQEYSNFWLR